MEILTLSLDIVNLMTEIIQSLLKFSMAWFLSVKIQLGRGLAFASFMYFGNLTLLVTVHKFN